jgi:hypothetical protein
MVTQKSLKMVAGVCRPHQVPDVYALRIWETPYQLWLVDHRGSRYLLILHLHRVDWRNEHISVLAKCRNHHIQAACAVTAGPHPF